MRLRSLVAPLALLMLLVLPLSAQDQMARAFDLERRGNYAQAAEVYRGLLSQNPGEVAALLGLERSLTPINRLAEILPAVRAALAANPRTQAIYGVALRAYSQANLLDSIPALVEQWSRVAPNDETPYREWAAAALARRDRATAKRAYQMGRERIGRPDVLAPEIAQLAVLEEDWPTATREWAAAIRKLPGYRSSALGMFAQAPESARPAILRGLEQERGPEPTRLLIDLRARWGDPTGAYEAMMRSLPAATPGQIEVLQGFLEQLRGENTPTYQLVQARTMEALSERWSNPAQKARFRLDAARAYAGAGSTADARRMLRLLADDPTTGPAIASGASATLVDLLIKEGKPEEASAELEQLRNGLPVDEYLKLRRQVAARWGQQGEVEKAETLIAQDSSIDALALRGRFRLYAGDLKGVSDLWREAGPFAGTREEATERAALLALLQPIQPDTLVALGQAFQRLDRGDSLAAAAAFVQVGATLPAGGGRAEVTLFGGRVYAGLGKAEEAERSFRAAVTKEAPATAAAALLELGRFYLGRERREEAVAVLEQMILDYPQSALVPQARRLLDQARNAIPRT
jgi:tetratricopeptide (TPR) repeat protein